MCARVRARMCVYEDQRTICEEPALFFHHVASWDGSPVLSLGGKHLHPLTHLAGSKRASLPFKLRFLGIFLDLVSYFNFSLELFLIFELTLLVSRGSFFVYSMY